MNFKQEDIEHINLNEPVQKKNPTQAKEEVM